jgi:hypothetical protein
VIHSLPKDWSSAFDDLFTLLMNPVQHPTLTSTTLLRYVVFDAHSSINPINHISHNIYLMLIALRLCAWYSLYFVLCEKWYIYINGLYSSIYVVSQNNDCRYCGPIARRIRVICGSRSRSNVCILSLSFFFSFSFSPHFDLISTNGFWTHHTKENRIVLIMLRMTSFLCLDYCKWLKCRNRRIFEETNSSSVGYDSSHFVDSTLDRR